MPSPFVQGVNRAAPVLRDDRRSLSRLPTPSRFVAWRNASDSGYCESQNFRTLELVSVAQRADTTDCVSGRRYASVRAESRGAMRSRRPPLPANGRSPNGRLPSHFHIFRRTARQRAAPPGFAHPPTLCTCDEAACFQFSDDWLQRDARSRRGHAATECSWWGVCDPPSSTRNRLSNNTRAVRRCERRG